MTKHRDERNELRLKGPSELQKMLAAAREELRDLRFRVAADQHKDIREIRSLRRRIARILTVQRTPARPSKREKL